MLPYQEAPDPPVTPELREACARAMHVIRADGEVVAGGRAVLFVYRTLGYRGWPVLLSLPPFVWGTEAAYQVVARNRRVFGGWFFRGE